jgi:uncharacterized membrane protein
MRLLKLIFKRETLPVMLALMLASAVSVALVIARMAWTRNHLYAFLVWNLVLAWMPLLFALLARDSLGAGRPRTWRFYGLAAAWLLFFPNAPYIFTDLIHLTTWFSSHFWIDLALFLLCAFIGLVLGFLSLYLMQSIVAQLYGRVAGWLFAAAAAGLCSVGIYLGRFLRFNSWDVILRPGKIFHGIDAWMDGRAPHLSSAGFLAFFATFLFLAYLMLYALAHLPRAQEMRAQLDAGPLKGA